MAEPVLEVEDLRKSYRLPDGGVSPVVDVPEFRVEAGQEVALRGASGSGKTTFLNLLAGILRADGGRVALCGRDLARLGEGARDRHRARNLGYVFQTFNLLQGYTALENVELGMLFGGRVDESRARALLERVGLADKVDHRPAQLSVGQQQRVAVARALANRPALVLADEPTGNLDRKSARGALELIRGVARENGAALLLVSHDPEVLGAFETVTPFEELNRAQAEDAGAEVRA